MERTMYRLQLFFLHEQRCDGGTLTISDCLDFSHVRIFFDRNCVHFFAFSKKFLNPGSNRRAFHPPNGLNLLPLSIAQLQFMG